MPVNLPNILTLGRIVLVPVVVVVVLLEAKPDGSWIAAALFAAASATDGLDGYLARRRSSVTKFGKVMDPIADKLLVAAALIALVGLDRLAAWIAVVIIAREFAVTGLRVVAGEQGAEIAASQFGKAKTAIQNAAVIVLIGVPDAGATWVQVLVYAAVVITVASGIDYFVNFRRELTERRRTATAREPRPATAAPKGP